MKSPLRFTALTFALASAAVWPVLAQTSTPKPPVRGLQYGPGLVQMSGVLRGEVQYLERIALPPGAMLHISLVGRVEGAEYLPLATAVVPARSGITRFALPVPEGSMPPGPYRLQAWIIGDNRAMFVGRDAQTTITNLDKPATIRLKMVPAPQNTDGFGDGRPLAATTKITLTGTVLKLDRRALLPDSRIELEVRDVSLDDAPSKLVMGQVIQLEGGQLPHTFSLQLEPTDLQPRHRYALSARVFEAGKLTFLSDTLNEVSPETSAKPVEVPVVPVSQPTPQPAP